MITRKMEVGLMVSSLSLPPKVIHSKTKQKSLKRVFNYDHSEDGGWSYGQLTVFAYTLKYLGSKLIRILRMVT